MKTLKCLVIFILVLLNFGPISAHFGFNFWQPFQSGNLNYLLSRFTSLESLLNSIRSQFLILEQSVPSQLASSQAIIAGLQNKIAAINVPKCPTTAIAPSVVIGTFCYSVSSAPTTFSNALTICETAGGSLAEPQPTPAASNNLYTALKSSFPSAFSTIEASNDGLWIGYTTPTSGTTFNYQSVTTRATVTTGAVITATGTALSQAALLSKPGGAYWVPALITSSHPYVCQYNTLS